MGVENDTFINSAYNVHCCTQRWFLDVTVQQVNELITAMLEIDLSLTQHEIDGKIT